MCLAACCSCVGTACLGCCCAGFRDCKVKYGPPSRIPYIFLMFVCCLFAICMSLFGEKVLWSNDLLDASFSVCSSQSCKGNGSVYRTSFTLFIFFTVHAVVVYCVLAFHHLFLIFKVLSLVIFLTVTFWIPGDFFDGYAQFARVASAFFLLIQIYVLISWAHDMNDRILLKIEKTQSEYQSEDADEDASSQSPTACMYKIGLVGSTLLLNAFCIVLWVLLFTWFTAGSDCDFNSGMISVTIVLVIIMTMLPPLIGHGSIFTTAVVAFYCTFLCYSAMEATPIEDCNVFAGDSSTAGMWVGILITTAAISYTGFSVSQNGSNLTNGRPAETTAAPEINMELQVTKDDNDDEEAGDANADAENTADINDSNYDDDDDENAFEKKVNSNPGWKAAETKANVMFHICMALSAIYVAMLYTAWGTNEISAKSGSAKSRGWTSVYVNLICMWITIILYIWTLIAPKVCPSRFGAPNDEDSD